MIYDTIVIGAGPAGSSAAIYLRRFNRSVLLITHGKSTLASLGKIENYYGCYNQTGKEIYENGLKQAKSLGAEVLDAEVVNITLGDTLCVKTTEGEFISKSIFLATGKPRNKTNIKNAYIFEGKGISYCAICDGFLYRGKEIALIGNSFYMEEEYEILKRFSKDLLIFTNGLDYKGSLDVIKDEIVSFEGSKRLEKIVTKEKEYSVDACFIAEGSQSGISFAKQLGIILDDKDNIVVKDYQTNIPNIFAGGDAIGGVMQIVKSANDGALAAIKINEFLKK